MASRFLPVFNIHIYIYIWKAQLVNVTRLEDDQLVFFWTLNKTDVVSEFFKHHLGCSQL